MHPVEELYVTPRAAPAPVRAAEDHAARSSRLVEAALRAARSAPVACASSTAT